jgi:hypothetical protein
MTLAGEDREGLGGLVAEREIRRTIDRYCRGVDRRDFGLVRSCYHPDATDDHGAYAGGLDGFIEYIERELKAFETTVHSVTNVLIDEIDESVAHSEAYATAFHRIAASSSKPRRDYLVGFRFLDRFERRDGRWLIAARRIVIDWTRMDAVGAGIDLPDSFTFGSPSSADPSYRW